MGGASSNFATLHSTGMQALKSTPNKPKTNLNTCSTKKLAGKITDVNSKT